MHRELSAREREAALFLIRNAVTSPSEDDYREFSDELKEFRGPPEVLTAERRDLWERNLAEVVVTNECDCGTCPSIGMRPRNRVDDPGRSDVGGEGDHSERIVLDAGVDGAMLLLFIDDASPSYLELAPLDETTIFLEFPSADKIVC